MERFQSWVLAAFLCIFAEGQTHAADPAADAILNKAAQAIGGAEKLAKADAFSWNAKCHLALNRTEAFFRSNVTIQGLENLHRDVHYAQYQLNVIVTGTKGWRTLKDKTREMAALAVASEKHTIYLMAVAIKPLLLKGSGFAYRAAADENVGGKPASVIKVTGPGDKDFKVYFDKQTGLPVKEVARVPDLEGKPYNLDITFADFRDFSGIKKATRITMKSDDSLVQVFELTEFKVLEKVDPETFAKPSGVLDDTRTRIVSKTHAPH